MISPWNPEQSATPRCSARLVLRWWGRPLAGPTTQSALTRTVLRYSSGTLGRCDTMTKFHWKAMKTTGLSWAIGNCHLKMVAICLTNYHGRPIIMKRLITKTNDFNGEHSTSKSLGLKKTKWGFDQHMICAFYRKIWELINVFLASVHGKWGGLGQHKLTIRPNKCIQMWT